MADKTFFLTTPIYYPNARPHVGSAYTTIVCDVIARYKRMCGYDVAFLTGTDEHGEKLERAAAAAGVSPQEFVAEKRKLFVQLWEKLGIPVTVYPEGHPDSLRFIYTHHPDHVTSVQRLLRLAQRNMPGIIEKRRYEGRYCVSDERYVSDTTDPVNCDICGRPAELISEENYFFRLSAFEKPLLELYERHPEFVKPNYRMNEVRSFVKSGLRDISVSRRRLKWGIPWPDDPEQVFYVWYDALTSYMTGIGYAQGENGSAEFQKYWRNKPGESEIVHMIGKDILRFHAVYWPAFIMAAYPGQPEMLPTTVFAHGWIYYEQDKMSKSKGNVVYPEPIVDALDSFGAPGNDALRYYLLRESTFGQDMSFSYDALIQRYNSDLANGLGNLANRTITMLNHDYAGKVPVRVPGSGSYAILARGLDLKSKEDQISDLATDTKANFHTAFDSCDYSRALDSAWSFISQINKYLVEEQPWSKTRQLDQGSAQFVTVTPEHLQTVLYTATAALRFLAVLLDPVIPHACQKLWEQLGQQGRVTDQNSDQLKFQDLRPGTEVRKPEAIFPRLDKEKTLAKLYELAEADYDRDKPKEALKSVETESAKPPEPPSGTGFQPVKEDTAKMGVPPTPSTSPPAPSTQPPVPSPDQKISIEDFAKVDMRVGEVLTAERVANAQKLLKLTVDIGTEVRQVVAGIAEHYKPEDLIGMKVVVVTNLEPRKLRGVESNGMIVAASVGEGEKPVLVTFKEDVPKGARLK
jgi:methionyl-tRNA synthetase